MTIENSVAVVTGASRGIGQAIALELGRRGATVAGTATSADGADNISAYLAEAGINGAGYCLDVADAGAVDEFCRAVQSDLGTPGILVNNAGITRDNLLMRMKPEEWQAVIDTNLSAVYRMSRALLRGMSKARWGRIISVSSVVASSGNPGQSNYAASKAGIEGFSRALAAEVAARGVTVNCIAPGFINTDMTRDLPEEHSRALMAKIPMGRYGEAQEIAAVVGFLASPEAGYITGETIHVNGGMYMA